MGRSRRTESALSVQEWYDCPMCGVTRFRSEPVDPVLRAWLAARQGGGVRLAQPGVSRASALLPRGGRL
jgi:hypothetical protein